MPDVTLKDMDGRTIALRPLLEADQPMMLNFIYTSCSAICPLMSETFAQVQRELGRNERQPDNGPPMTTIPTLAKHSRPSSAR